MAIINYNVPLKEIGGIYGLRYLFFIIWCVSVAQVCLQQFSWIIGTLCPTQDYEMLGYFRKKDKPNINSWKSVKMLLFKQVKHES